MVGQTLASGIIKQGYEVKIGTNHPEKLNEWLTNNETASVGNFSETSSFGEIVVLAIKGTEVENVIKQINQDNFKNKIVIDVTNPLLVEKEGQLPKMSVAYPNSLGSNIQKLLPESKVVKAFNASPSIYMTNPKLQEGNPDLFIAGNHNDAKDTVKKIASNWGWSVIDLGSIEQAYLVEALSMVWINYGFLNNHWTHAFKLLRK